MVQPHFYVRLHHSAVNLAKSSVTCRDAINRVRVSEGDFDALMTCYSANNTFAYADAIYRVPTSDGAFCEVKQHWQNMF